MEEGGKERTFYLLILHISVFLGKLDRNVFVYSVNVYIYKHIPYIVDSGNFLLICLTTQLILAVTIIVAVF